jgi:hypothetical protein
MHRYRMPELHSNYSLRFKALFIFLLMLCCETRAQEPNFPIDPSTRLITYSEVVAVQDSANKSELYSRAKSCFAHLFKSAQDVVQNDDKEAGTIIGKATVKAYARAMGADFDGGYVRFTLTIACKDGRYKYTFTNFIHEGTGSKMPSGGNLENTSAPTWTDRQWNLMKSQIHDNVQDMISTLKTAMNKPSPQSEDW